ncbi:MAG: ABC transporter permease subunit [Azospirillaceae bacterium]|nr:ABC transporter permease subunit [Azospirillaceae bacterium]
MKTFRIELRGLAVVIALALAWEIGVRFSGAANVPSIGGMLVTARAALANGGLQENYLASLMRVAVGFATGAGAGVAVGALLGISRWAERLVGPPITLLRQVPILGLIPMLGLWFGIGETAKIVLVAMAAFYPVALNTHEGLRGVPASYRDVARVMTFSRWRLLRRVLLPWAMPAVMTGLKQGLAFAWIAVVAAELFLATAPGVGNILEAGRNLFQMNTILLGMALIGATGALMNILVTLLERRLLRWRTTFA